MKGWNLVVRMHQWCPEHEFSLSPKSCWRVGGVPQAPGRRQQFCLSVLIRMSWFGLSGTGLEQEKDGMYKIRDLFEAVTVQCQGCV